MQIIKKIGIVFSAIIIFLLILFIAGPKIEVDDTVPVVSIPDNLDEYLKNSESKIADIRPNSQKIIIWADPEQKRKTQYSLVHIHGYGASRQGMAPVPEKLAKKLGANLFCTRLKGHGRSSVDAMRAPTTRDWLIDAVEALEIGKRLGHNVILMANSTGCNLLVWLAMQNQFKDDIFAIVLMSPNFFPKSDSAKYVLWPWGKQMTRLIMGDYREWEPRTEAIRNNWSWKTPIEAVFTMMGLVDLVDKMDLSTMETPVLILHSNFDQVISVPKLKERFAEIGSMIKKRIEVNNTEDKEGHQLAGDILSPSTNEVVINHIYNFLTPIMKETD